ncbi:protein hairy [Coccinella septempunctata]|uniref:protein hairy n=1 Tax=Coccinella septempunctata TaxID=41139 RepID=UPI001D08CFDC|nr:protein hairy [Coccinella septempunctata]
MVQPTSTTINPSENGLHGVKKASDNRRSNKPIMEKRRRARINNCLNELKTLILDAMKKDPARHSKLEKADILEMTVKHLQNLQSQQVAMSAATDPAVLNKFRAGFSECVTEVGRFSGLDPTVRRRLLQHLTNCLNQNQKSQEVAQVQVHILPNNGASLEQVQHGNGIIFSNGSVGGVQLVPTRLPNGDLALVLPTSATQTHTRTTNTSPLPLLVPIPQRTSSTHSASSGSSNYSLSASPEPIVDHCYQPRPLSLVMRKNEQPVVEKPWRPW